jgi:3-oxoacid CoA-transferase
LLRSLTIYLGAAHTVIVEAEEIVEVGAIPPEQVHLPGLYVDRLFQGEKYEHKIEVLRFNNSGFPKSDTTPLERARELIAQVVAQEFRPGMKCNLGVGIPTMAAEFAAKMGVQVILQSENGVTGCGPYPERGQQDSDWINAGKETITPILGASTFGSDESFAQIRGGHLDMTVLGVSSVAAILIP